MCFQCLKYMLQSYSMSFSYLQIHWDNFALSNVHFLFQAKECPYVFQHDTSTGYLKIKCFILLKVSLLRLMCRRCTFCQQKKQCP